MFRFEKHIEKTMGWILIFTIIMVVILSLSSCYGTYVLTDAEYSDVRESHASLTYYQGNIYWGWHSGYYYYYGTPHYYPWYYYYNTCPPSHYTTTTHVIINRPVNKPTHRPNIRVKTNTNSNNKVIIKNNNGSKRTNKTTIRRKPKK